MASAINYDVIFTVPTSPDSDSAHMWGHMDEVITVGNDTFYRPKLKDEFPSAPTVSNEEANETWGRLDYSKINNKAVGGCDTDHLPTSDQLSSLYNANKSGTMNSVHGWPVNYGYLSSTKGTGTSTSWNTVAMNNGTVSVVPATYAGYFSCLKNPNLTPTQLTIQTLDEAQWFDSLKAAKAQKGDTLQLKITTKDAAGTPVPSTPVVISRGDDYNRQNARLSTPSPMVINGQTLSSTSSVLNGVTGADGTLMLTVTRENTAGTKAAIVAKLFANTSVTASMDTIFTVVTSPDSAKAVYWGHMPETLTATDGTVFKRPLLLDELSQKSGILSNLENNETWALFNWTQAQNSSAGGCGDTYTPLQAALDSLYNANSGGAISSIQGWPTGRNYWSSTADDNQQGSRYYKSVNLKTDASIGEVVSQSRLLTCRSQPSAKASQIDISSAQYIDALAATRAPKGSKITLQVTSKDAQGNPVPNTAFTLTRDTSAIRAGTPNTGSASYLMVGYTGGQSTSMQSTANKFFGVTDNNGQAQLDVSQDNSPGLKTTLTATQDDNTAVKTSMPVIFSVITSPDSAKAQFWGHMPETLTAANGMVFKRPRLFDELPQTSGFASVSTGGEKWVTFKYAQAQDANAGGCGDDYIPEQSNLDSLYSVWPNGAITSDQGWPTVATYWSSTADSTAGNTRNYQGVNMSTDASSKTPATQTLMLTCQSQKRIFAGQLVLSSAQYVDTLSAAKAVQGSKITMLVTTNDEQGNPVPNTAFSLAHNISTNRVGATNTSTASNLYVTPSGGQTQLMTSSSRFYFVTDNSGHLQLEIAQDNTVGLKTPLVAMLDHDNTVVQDMPVIFTVITSPDSDKAQYWGHMPETFTASNGVEYQRPLLYDEYPVSVGVSSYTTAGEKWPLATPATMDSGACTRNQMPLLSDLQALYVDHSGGSITTTLGWPTVYAWWAGDQKVVGASQLNDQYVNMRTGVVGSTASTTMANTQVCLTKPRGKTGNGGRSE